MYTCIYMSFTRCMWFLFIIVTVTFEDQKLFLLYFSYIPKYYLAQGFQLFIFTVVFLILEKSSDY